MPYRRLRIVTVLSVAGSVLLATIAYSAPLPDKDVAAVFKRMAAQERYVRRLCTSVHSSVSLLARRSGHPRSSSSRMGWDLDWWKLPRLIGAKEIRGMPVDPAQYRGLILTSWLNNASDRGFRDVAGMREGLSSKLGLLLNAKSISAYKIHVDGMEGLGKADILQIDDYNDPPAIHGQLKRSPLGFSRYFIVLSSSTLPNISNVPVSTDMKESFVTYKGSDYFIGSAFDIGSPAYVEPDQGHAGFMVIADICVRGRDQGTW